MFEIRDMYSNFLDSNFKGTKFPGDIWKFNFLLENQDLEASEKQV